MEIIATYGTIFLVLAIVFGFYMTWGIGANDVANAMGTSVGSGAVTVKQAIIIAAIFEFAGAFIAGGNVTSTIRKGIVDPSSLVDQPEILVFGMLASLLAAAVWLMVASWRGWPVSTTHSIVGAVVGFAMAEHAPERLRSLVIGGAHPYADDLASFAMEPPNRKPHLRYTGENLLYALGENQ